MTGNPFLVSGAKAELVDHLDFFSRAAPKRSIFDYLEVFYSRRRRRSTLGYVSPAEYEQVAGSDALAA
ncbi:IS3 family transposase [Anaeromyxobacter oryzisoli]|uniref:IS3 family transposase n=1 Tax=Anaeromyxobacter oryzisoli TaxID=2925408 RepID=UPI0024130826|nr:IS3 family transposase [Anaeromyxobacter sp. SG63]